MRRRIACLTALILSAFSFGPAIGQAPDAALGCDGAICWRIENRFRLFKDGRDFARHEAVWRAGARDVLAMERALAADAPGGWARPTVDRLCFNERLNIVPPTCVRDGETEAVLKPKDFAVEISAAPGAAVEGSCAWSFPAGAVRKVVRAQEGVAEGAAEGACAIRARIGRDGATIALAARAPDGTPVSVSIVARPRDLLVAGMGDSFTSGEGNPDRPARLAERGAQGVCYNRVYRWGLFNRPPGHAQHRDALRELQRRQQSIYVPSRAAAVSRDCSYDDVAYDDPAWTAARAQWMYAPCHRSLYGYQLRAALALALENPHWSVGYIPLGCTGATIPEGLLAGQPPRERQLRDSAGRYEAQVSEGQLHNLKTRLDAAGRKADLIFLSIGGNDVGFSGLVADVIVDAPVERWLLDLAGQIVTPQAAEAKLPAFKRDFARLRARLAQLVAAGDLDRVVLTPYGSPARKGATLDDLCGDGRRGFDAHPAFAVDGARLKQADTFVETKLTPTLQRLARCEATGDGACAGERQKMRYAATHRDAFFGHGVCAPDAATPAFDRCFRDGDTFRQASSDPPSPLDQPMKHCPAARMSDFAPYAARGRWFRTVNDSYLTAMSFPDSLPGYLKARLRNDGLWGLFAMVYGGALHPTAEGHAAMADAALIEARAALARP
ncbi:MAG: hypothetical protein IPL88_04415 [Rhizobiales bacterium]|nr:hypothetical protein [Hyphomicrobiales bacterium]